VAGAALDAAVAAASAADGLAAPAGAAGALAGGEGLHATSVNRASSRTLIEARGRLTAVFLLTASP